MTADMLEIGEERRAREPAITPYADPRLRKRRAQERDQPAQDAEGAPCGRRIAGPQQRRAVLVTLTIETVGGRNRQTPAHKVYNTRAALRVRIEQGAIWNPGDTLNDARRTLYRTEPDVTVELVGLLVKDRACNDATLHDLLRTPRMQAHMKLSEERLRRLGLTLDGRRRSEVREQQVSAPSAYLLSRYDRKRLYDELWAEPTKTVAARYGISDVALGKSAGSSGFRSLHADIGPRRLRGPEFRLARSCLRCRPEGGEARPRTLAVGV